MENRYGYGDLEAAAIEITSLRDQLRACRNELRNTQETVRRLQDVCEERYEQGRAIGIMIGIGRGIGGEAPSERYEQGREAGVRIGRHLEGCAGCPGCPK